MCAKHFLCAMTAGAVVGAVMGMVIDPINDKQHKKIHRSANNMFKTLGSIVDGIIS